MSTPPLEPAVVELAGITHRYGPTVALSDCRLSIAPGEVHGLVGENGSGKSTVVKLLSGIMRPTEGEVRVGGKAVDLRSPAAAQRHEIVTVFQETLVSDECSGLDNVFAGTDGIFRRARSGRAEREAAERVVASLGASPAILQSSPHHLSLAERQVLTLTRALVRPWKLLILDEATSALDLSTRDRLFAVLADHRREGRSVLFVSHRMDELEILIDRATVQRSGRTVGTVGKDEATPARLLSMMSGRSDAGEHHVRAGARSRQAADVVLRGVDLSLVAQAPAFDLDVRRGEILGIGGLDGQGGSHLVEVLAGVRPTASGRVEVDRDGSWTRVTGYRQAFRSGIAYVPGKRQEEGLFPSMTVGDNLSMATLPRHARAGLFRSSSVLTRVREEMTRLGVVPHDPSYPITGLSGGNAQKVLVGRWLAAEPDVLILNDPLRGVDLGTKRDFYALLRELTEAGTTVVMLSTEIEELLTCCDRVAVCQAERVFDVLEGEDLTYDAVLAAMFGRHVSDEQSSDEQSSDHDTHRKVTL
ncbi:sugar ABC transporter ATP-binding protein [Nocardioides sp. 503]|uniref:sugar ABC transporter ATP-binding protein n=1 Tax=Nocardioides sp. 503 TaxID=2508326 RepID=UPI00106FF0AE|nr:sugar ABC transporter ATP-binding protein [Nocardioides sp. 503]